MTCSGIIYVVVCRTTGLRYVGQTRSPLSRRWNEHVRHAGQVRKQKVRKLAHAINFYGRDDFDVIPLFSAFSGRDLDVAERYFISKMRTMHPAGFNLSRGGKRRAMTSAIRRSISDGVRALWAKPGHREKIARSQAIAVVATNLKTGEECHFYSAVEGAKILGVSKGNVYSVLLGTRRQAGGYLWRRA